MGVKHTYTAEEWQVLLKLPFKIGVTLMVVAPSGPIGLTKETMALAKAPFALAQVSNANALISALAAELQAVAACERAAAALRKASAEDARAYRTWVLAVGQKVAEAAKDGSVLVSDQEKVLLQELRGALGGSAL